MVRLKHQIDMYYAGRRCIPTSHAISYYSVKNIAVLPAMGVVHGSVSQWKS